MYLGKNKTPRKEGKSYAKEKKSKHFDIYK